MSKYRDEPPRQIGANFSEKMRNFLDEKIRHSRNGIDMNMDKKGAPPFLLYLNQSMTDEIFDLGCAIHDKHPDFDFKAWVHWMVDAELDRQPDGITVWHRTKFFCEYADKYVGAAIRDYYGVPVKFKPSVEIANRVAA